MSGDDMILDRLVELYRSMFLIRRFEERADHLRQQGFIPGFLHPYVGQEGVAVGVCAALEEGDVITSTHRGHGHMLARGADPARMYAELYARQDGYNRAKGGSLHMIDVELGFLGANGIVGGGSRSPPERRFRRNGKAKGGWPSPSSGTAPPTRGAFTNP